MTVREIRIENFRRFTQLTIADIPPTAHLIVLAGPNGSGKSSFFDALKYWHLQNGGSGNNDPSYLGKLGYYDPVNFKNYKVEVEPHGILPSDQDERKKLVYVRSAFRHQTDFVSNSISMVASPLDSPRVQRMIDPDESVFENYQRLVMETIDGLYSDAIPETMSKAELRERVVGEIRDSIARIFPSLTFSGVGRSVNGGTFLFGKGGSENFPYKNLSAGERAVFDLILDAVVKRRFFENTLWCIDEPETHLHSRIQGQLLDELCRLVPDQSQLIVATHSIGFMRRAWELHRENPDKVVFIDFGDQNFDEPVTLRPVEPSRGFWQKTLDVALGDLASLVAPSQVVLCEGKPVSGRASRDKKAEFDAKCYRKIFGPRYPTTDWISVGNSDQVSNDNVGLGSSILTLVPGTKVIRLIDRDERTDEEIAELALAGVRVLDRRNIEEYLLDDEVLDALCGKHSKAEIATQFKRVRDDAIAASMTAGHGRDFKRARGEVYNTARNLLGIEHIGSNFEPFAVDFLAPLLKPGMKAYDDLEKIIFGV